MKCVCGYKYEYEYIKNKKNTIVGDEEFIQITTVKNIETDKNISDYYKVFLRGNLYICPKCRTVRFEENY